MIPSPNQWFLHLIVWRTLAAQLASSDKPSNDGEVVFAAAHQTEGIGWEAIKQSSCITRT